MSQRSPLCAPAIAARHGGRVKMSGPIAVAGRPWAASTPAWHFVRWTRACHCGTIAAFSISAGGYVADFEHFAAFYPYYLSQHSHRICRRWHFIGSSLVLAITLFAVFTRQWGWLWLLPLAGYGCAWIGHYVYQKNRPATFTHPLYSLRGDWVMYTQMLRGKLRF